MSNRRLFFETILVHLLAWWGIRILSGQMPLMHSFDANTSAWFAIRLARAILTVAVVLAWARWRKIVLQDVGIGDQSFWRNFAIMFGVVAVLWLIVVMFSGNPLEAPNPIGYGARTLAAITAFVDVLAQQLPTFGLLQGLGMKHERTAIAFGLAWCSYTFAHLIGSSLPYSGSL